MSMSISVDMQGEIPSVVMDCRDVHASLGGTEILKGCDLTLRKNKIAVIFGRSGSGKTTLLRCLTGFLDPDSGTVRVRMQEPEGSQPVSADPSPHLLAAWGQKNGMRAVRGLLYAEPSPSAMMFAEDQNLLPQLTSEENLLLPLAPICSDSNTRNRLAREALDLVGLFEQAGRRPEELSSGQRRRLSLAQCMLRGPQFVALDEPTSALDTHTKYEILTMMQRLQASLGLTAIVVTHDIDTVLLLADEIHFFDDGRIVEVDQVPIAKPRAPEALGGPGYSSLRKRLIDFLIETAQQ